MLRDPDRQAFCEEYFLHLEEELGALLPTVDWVMNHVPVLRSLFRRILNGWVNTWHGGQVVPVEDAKATLRLADENGGIARYSCVCRRMLGGKRHEPMCLFYGVNFPWARPLSDFIDFTPEFEPLSLEEAEKFLDETDRQGLVHHLATLKTPFLLGICSCEYPTCIFMRARRDWGIQRISRKGEYLARVDTSSCNRCGKCLERCQFGALHYAPESDVVAVDYEKCFGCGVCRRACSTGAITLVGRETLPKYKDMY
jgi:ferredoxin